VANRTGDGASIARISRQQPGVSAIPAIQFSTTGGKSDAMAEAAYSVANTLKRMSSRVEDRLDLQAAADAAKAGAIAGQEDKMPALEDETTIRGRAFNQSAKEAVGIRIDLQARTQLNDYEQKNLNNPLKFRAAADSYLTGVLPKLKEFDPALAQSFEAQYKLRAEDADNRIQARQRAIIADQQTEQALKLQLAAQDEMAQQAAELFTGNPADVQKKLAGMISNASRIVDTAHQIGPDGQPLFSARERVNAERQAQEAVGEQVGRAWMKAQPDMLTAFDTWRKGEAEIEVADDQGKKAKVPLRDLLGETSYQKAEASFYENLRSELALRNQVEDIKDHAFKKNSDDLYSDLLVVAQSGPDAPLAPGASGPTRPAGLTLDVVDAARSQLEPDRYLALRTIAKGGGAAVSDGPTVARLAAADADGHDIRGQLRTAYNAGQLTTDDFVKYYNQNSGRMDQGPRDPVSAGRDALTQKLGVLSKDIGLAQSSSIGQASIEYEIAVNDFVAKEARAPNIREARDISDAIYERFSAVSVDDSIISLPLPRSMTQAEKLNAKLTSAQIEQKVEKVNAEYLARHNGDAAARAADEEYQGEIKTLKRYFDLLKLKEMGNERQPTKAR
jgi:hypothetical protein